MEKGAIFGIKDVGVKAAFLHQLCPPFILGHLGVLHHMHECVCTCVYMSLSYFSALFFQVTVKRLNFWNIEQYVLGKLFGKCS